MVSIILIILLSISFAVLVLYTFLTIKHRPARLKAYGRLATKLPAVSILKPLRDLDDGLEQNLESFYNLDYPDYEILFAVDSEEAQCTEIVRRLMTRYPHVSTTILATGNSCTSNPKIHKLSRLERHSRGQLFWVTDSNVRVERDSLSRMVLTYLNEEAKIVFTPVRGQGSLTLGSLMNNISLNFFTSGSIISSWELLKLPIVVGKSMLIERTALETFGGFSYFKDYLAEDFLLGETFVKSGFRVSLGGEWVTNFNQKMSIRDFFNRMSRWAKLRFNLRPAFYVLELLLNPILIAAAGVALQSFRGAGLLAGAVALKMALEYSNFLAVGQNDRKRISSHLLFPVAVILKDFLFFAVYLAPFLSRRVSWRNEKIAIGKRTLISLPHNQDSIVYEGA